MESERILPVLIFALVLFFQFVVPLLRRRMEEAVPPDEGEEATAPARVVVRTPPVPRVETPAPVRVERRAPARRAAPPAVLPPAAPRRPSPLGSIADVRRGIVLMTILGPCRAAEEPDSRGVG